MSTFEDYAASLIHDRIRADASVIGLADVAYYWFDTEPRVTPAGAVALSSEVRFEIDRAGDIDDEDREIDIVISWRGREIYRAACDDELAEEVRGCLP